LEIARRQRALDRLPDKHEVEWFRERLRNWFVHHRRDFLWRSSADPYVICIAEIFLQQTTAKKVADFIGTFIEQFPNWDTLANASIDQIAGVIFPLGIYQRRARTVHELANIMVKRGNLPRTRQGLENLPGIGQYIANVLLVVLQHKREPFLDTNMSRVLERFFGPRELADIRYDPYLQSLAKIVVNTSNSLSTNWMILDFAAMVCTKRRPRCISCPLYQHCSFARKIQQDMLVNTAIQQESRIVK
jgi:A/G-specific adenine glycosylase